MTRAELCALLLYDPDSGEFRWRVTSRHGKVKPGDVAGCFGADGYRVIKIAGRYYRSHRLAWLYVYGVLPVEIDHKDRDRGNNRISNLRSATRSQNVTNAGLRRDNTSGFRGVSRCKRGWIAQVGSCKKNRVIGIFVDPGSAALAYDAAAMETFGEFAVTNRSLGLL